MSARRLACGMASLLLALASFACADGERSAPEPAPNPTEPALVMPDPLQGTSDQQIAGVIPEPTSTPSIQFVLPRTAAEPASAWRPPPYEPPWALRPEDHFLFARPIPSGDVNWPNPRYRYGSTLFGEETIHTGVDLGAERDTPVIAAGPGEVVWVGFGLYRGIEDPTDPYGLAIAIRHDFGHERERLFTIYAHLQSANVWPGQRVETGEQIGTVGETGHASGPHLHFEVRKGENRYFATRNPELWMVPAEGWGVLAGKVENTYGGDLSEHLIQIRSVESGRVWDVWTYALGTVVPDEIYQENFVISDLPAGPYEVTIQFLGKNYVMHLLVKAGQTNFIRFYGRRGFAAESAAPTADLVHPPFP